MHTSAALLLELGLVLTVISILGTWARRLSLSPVPLYLLAGLFLGEGGIAPVPAAGEFLETGASIGIVLLLLALGLDFSVTEFAVSMRRHVPSAGIDLLLNALPGELAGFLLGLDGVGILALAGVTYISSSGIVARLLSDLRRLGNRETPAVLSVLVLEDFAMAAYLPVLVVLASGGTWWQAVAGVLLALGAVLVAFAASYRFGGHLQRLISHPEPEQLMFRVLGLTLIVAALAELVYLSAAVGAFLILPCYRLLGRPWRLSRCAARRRRPIRGQYRDLTHGRMVCGFSRWRRPSWPCPRRCGTYRPRRVLHRHRGADRGPAK